MYNYIQMPQFLPRRQKCVGLSLDAPADPNEKPDTNVRLVDQNERKTDKGCVRLGHPVGVALSVKCVKNITNQYAHVVCLRRSVPM